MSDTVVSTFLKDPIKTCAVSVTLASLGYFAITGLKDVLFRDSAEQPYPPGPPREPLIGALRSFPRDHFLQRFNEWARKYGDIVYAPVPGMNIVILNSYEVANELLNKRPSSTGGRRTGYLLTKLMGWEWIITFLSLGVNHSNQRKMIRRGLGPQRVGCYDANIESAVEKLMTVLDTFQGNPSQTIKHCLGHLTSISTYGDQILKEMGSDLSHWNHEAMDTMAEAIFSFWLVDVFHSLRFVPDWIPGLRFKNLAREATELSENIRYRAYRRGVELYKTGALGHSILNDLLEEFGEDEDVRDSTATTAAIIQFIHALFLFPDISEKVFSEVEAVTHGERLPQVSDRPHLPYAEAVWKEAIRWSPVIPLGVPHVNDQDEVIRGYFIPKGTMIQQNVKMMLNDPDVWGDPEVFRPERFLEPEAALRPNPLTVQFGWGMRICPGLHFADRIILHMVVTIISLYKIEPLEGHQIPDPKDIHYDSKAVQQPIGFECRFVARDERARNLLKSISLSD
ncbi:cytochrome P450 [Serendipita vermifera]|nr:cytochrome P450 [Serendipita vermifera]